MYPQRNEIWDFMPPTPTYWATGPHFRKARFILLPQRGRYNGPWYILA